VPRSPHIHLVHLAHRCPVWDDLRQILGDPELLQDAIQRFRDGWLTGEERQARRRDLPTGPDSAHIERLVDAYQAEALTLEELQARRAQLEARLAEMLRDEQGSKPKLLISSEKVALPRIR
jgi:hypothetical protein